jgi:hypothetical protein
MCCVIGSRNTQTLLKCVASILQQSYPYIMPRLDLPEVASPLNVFADRKVEIIFHFDRKMFLIPCRLFFEEDDKLR